jgi:hypothetical protein
VITSEVNDSLHRTYTDIEYYYVCVCILITAHQMDMDGSAAIPTKTSPAH